MNDKLYTGIGQSLLAGRSVAIVSHTRPDGDAVGSVLGLGLSLRQAGKSIQMLLPEGVPQNFHHLEGAKEIGRKIKGEVDLKITVDCSDMARLGGLEDKFGVPHLNIDHHTTNTLFAPQNLVIENAVSTTEIIFHLLTANELPLTPAVASALLTGLITDSLGFLTPNVTANALKVAARLMELGADLPLLYRKALIEKSYEAMRFWGAGLSLLEREDNMVWASLKMEDRKNIGYPGRDDADLINQLSSIKEGDIRLVFVEQPENQVKVSWRSAAGYDVATVAGLFGGGGHRNASGAMIEGALEDVRTSVLNATRQALLQKSHANTPN